MNLLKNKIKHLKVKLASKSPRRQELLGKIIDDFEIITGNSEQMKQIVREICSNNGFRAESNWNGNSGSLLVTVDRL